MVTAREPGGGGLKGTTFRKVALPKSLEYFSTFPQPAKKDPASKIPSSFFICDALCCGNVLGFVDN
jgi:hypothetical protein